MKKTLRALLFFFVATQAFAQVQTGKPTPGDPKSTRWDIKKSGEVNLRDAQNDFAVNLIVKEMPPQAPIKKPETDAPTLTLPNQKAGSATVQPPLKVINYFANPLNGTPNDNDMAVSDSGKVISVSNSYIYVRDIVIDSAYYPRSLFVFKYPVNTYNSQYDPKVLYDPDTDRFILVCLVGTVDSLSNVIVGFSKTNDPLGAWNLYELPGNPLNNNLWTDYPMITVSKNDFFLSANLLYNDSTWQKGFVETIIWQINKKDGYQGKTNLATTLHSGIKYNGHAIRNLCPVKGGSKTYGPNTYFLSNRNFATQCDTVFLVNVTDTVGAPGATVTVKVLTSNQPYYFPPDGIQPSATNSLASNDSRNLGAFYENGIIQYVHNTKNPATNHVSVYHGLINTPTAANPTVTGYIIQNSDNLDIAYPNISYAGNSGADNSSIISFDHASSSVFPGCSALQADGAGNYSSLLRLKDGANFINVLTSGQERWGDYTGSQRRYNNPGEVWMSGYYAYNFSANYPKAHGTWVSQMYTDALNASVPKTQGAVKSLAAYPNPSSDNVSLDIRLPKPEYLNVVLYDQEGKQVIVLLRDWVRATESSLNFSTRTLPKGIYMLEVKGNAGTSISKKIIVN